MCAQYRLSAAAHSDAQMSPSAMWGLLGIERFQIGVGLPLLEQQFDLPPKPIAVAEENASTMLKARRWGVTLRSR